jgi:hypothetical protein
LVVLKQVSSLGNSGIEPLVLAAASERADIALAARRVIEQQLATWRIQAEQDKHFSAAEPMALLAAALARHVDKFGAFGQQWATRLALDIVELADTFDVAAAMPILADCGTVLSAVPALGPRMLTPEVRTQPLESEPIVAALPEIDVPALPSDRTVAQGPSGISHESVGNQQTVEGLLPSTKPQDSNWTPEWQDQLSSTTPLPLPTESEDKAHTASVDEGLIDVPSPTEQAKMVESLRQLENRELFAQLNDTNRFKTAAIREVLVERGLTAEELVLATRLFAEDVNERLRLVDDLKILPARTARHWLRELLADKSAEVRLGALTALATTNDPELPSIARDLAVRDTDRRVAELASQIMRQMR